MSAGPPSSRPGPLAAAVPAGRGAHPRGRGLSIALPKGGDRATAVRNVSFSVGRGEIVCLVGESGSGKSVIALA
jgi:ABC-type multidrug transport system fused ATPase/permease subunit